MKICLTAAFALLLTMQYPAQSSDPFVGNFANEQTGITVTIRTGTNGYAGEFTYQGNTYPLSAVRLAGLLVGEYELQGKRIAFSIIRQGDSMTIVSEGVELPLTRRTAGTPDRTQPQRTETPPTTGSTAGTLLRDPFGQYTCTIPAGWNSTAENGSFVLRLTGSPVTLTITPHNETSIDQTLAQVASINNPAEKIFISMDGKKLNPTTAFVRLSGTAREQPVNLDLVTVFSPYGGGIVIAANYGNYSAHPSYVTILESIAASARFVKSEVPAAARLWSDRLRGRKLLFLQTDSYSSQRIDIDLYANGSFSYSGSDGFFSQGGVGTGTYAGSNRSSGTWKILMQNGGPVLCLYATSGGSTTFAIREGASPTQVLLNGRRYYIRNPE